jgi:hypothetical protein
MRSIANKSDCEASARFSWQNLIKSDEKGGELSGAVTNVVTSSSI